MENDFKSSQEDIMEIICKENGEENGINKFVKDWRNLFINVYKVLLFNRV